MQSFVSTHSFVSSQAEMFWIHVFEDHSNIKKVKFYTFLLQSKGYRIKSGKALFLGYSKSVKGIEKTQGIQKRQPVL